MLLKVKMKEADPVKNVGGMGLEMEVEVRATTDEFQSNNAIVKTSAFSVNWSRIAYSSAR